MSASRITAPIAAAAATAVPRVSQSQSPPPTGEQNRNPVEAAPSADSRSSSVAVARKLEDVRGTLAHLNDTIQKDLRKKGDAHFQSILTTRNDVVRLEQQLAIECRRRAEADTSFRQMEEQKLSATCEEIEGALEQRLAILSQHVENVTLKIDEISRDVIEQREKDEALLAEVRENSAKAMQDVRLFIEDERAQRMEGEAASLKQIKQETYKLMERLSIEAQMRERCGVLLHEDIDKVFLLSGRESAEHAKGQLLREVERLKEEITKEKAECENAQNEFVRAMEAIVQNIHEAVKRSVRS